MPPLKSMSSADWIYESLQVIDPTLSPNYVPASYQVSLSTPRSVGSHTLPVLAGDV